MGLGPDLKKQKRDLNPDGPDPYLIHCHPYVMMDMCQMNFNQGETLLSFEHEAYRVHVLEARI